MSIVKLNESNFEGNRLLNPYDNSDKPVFVLFKTDWCGYCKQFKPTYEELAKAFNGKITFCVVDGDECVDLKNKINSFLYGYKILGFPTLTTYMGGYYLNKYDGPRDLETLKQYISSNFSI